MNKIKPEEERFFYLQSGPKTVVTPFIEKIANLFPNNFEDFVNEFKKWRTTRIGHTEITDTEEWEKYFRNRSAVEIIEQALEAPDDHVGTVDCTDDAILFVTLSRAKGFPTKYIEAVLKTNSDGTEGHVFARVYDGGMWKLVDPASRAYETGLNPNDYAVIAEGLDYEELDLGTVDKIKEASLLARSVS